jgi:hypothetical protein
MAQAKVSIHDRLAELDSRLDSEHRRKLRKINLRFADFDLPDKLVLGSDGRVHRVPRVPKEAETKVKEEIKD